MLLSSLITDTNCIFGSGLLKLQPGEINISIFKLYKIHLEPPPPPLKKNLSFYLKVYIYSLKDIYIFLVFSYITFKQMLRFLFYFTFVFGEGGRCLCEFYKIKKFKYLSLFFFIPPGCCNFRKNSQICNLGLIKLDSNIFLSDNSCQLNT